MSDQSWAQFYASDLMGLTALLVVPVLFGLALPFLRPGADAGADARFVWRYAAIVTVGTILDPVCGGPLTRALGLGEAAATGVMLLFVLLGDFRIYWLLFALSQEPGEPGLRPSALRRAAVWTWLVPVIAFPLYRAAGFVAGGVHSQILWLLYELSFAAVVLGLRQRWLPSLALAPARRRFLSEVCLYVAVYYGLWATADLLILGPGLDGEAGTDLGWALRLLPNQLYYAFTAPFVLFRYRALHSR